MSFPFLNNPVMPGVPGFPFYNKAPMAPPLYIGDLDETVSDETLYEFFSKFGLIHFVRVMRNPSNGKSRGFAYVNFLYPRDAESARQFAQYKKLGRKYIRIMFKRNIRDLPHEANLYVKNLDLSVNVKDLHNHFQHIGPIHCCKVSTNNEGVSLGYGYVQFEKKEHADIALETMNHSKLKETEIEIAQFLPKDKRPATIERRNVYVKNLPLNKSEEEINKIIQDLFKKYGEIQTMLIKKHPSEPKYSAFVCFVKEDAAAACVEDITKNPVTLEGAELPLYINWHQSRIDRDRELKNHFTQASNDTNLFVKNLKPTVTEAELKEAFQRFGKVLSVAVKLWTLNEKIAKSGYIAFEVSADAKKAHVEAFKVPEIKSLYLDDAQPYINFHQVKERRNEYLYAQRRRKMQHGMMNMNPMMNMNYPFMNRRFQPFPYINSQKPMGRGGRQNFRGGYNYGGRGAPRHQGGYGQRRDHRIETAGKQVHNVPQVQNVNVLDESEKEPTLTVHTLKSKLQNFLSLPIDKQRQILGELLFPLVNERAGEALAPKITGMLIDLSVLEVVEILELLENPELLNERVSEAQELIMQEESA